MFGTSLEGWVDRLSLFLRVEGQKLQCRIIIRASSGGVFMDSLQPRFTHHCASNLNSNGNFRMVIGKAFASTESFRKAAVCCFTYVRPQIEYQDFDIEMLNYGIFVQLVSISLFMHICTRRNTSTSLFCYFYLFLFVVNVILKFFLRKYQNAKCNELLLV